MNELEQRIRNARIEAPPLPEDFADGVWAVIQEQGLHPLPRWRFVVRRAARGLAATLLLLGGLWAANTALYELLANGTVELLYFGTRFLGTFLTQLPFDLLLTMMALGALAAWLLRSGKLVRVRMAWVVLITYGLTGAGGLAGANSGINEALYQPTEVSETRQDGVLDYFRGRMHYRRPHPRVRMGRVVGVEDGALILETPLGETIRVNTPDPAAYPAGTHVRLLGNATPQGFETEEVQHCNPSRAGRYFRHMRGMKPGGMGPGGMGPGMRGMGPGSMGAGGMGQGMHGKGPGGRGPMMR